MTNEACKPELVILDLDNTIYDYNSCHTVALEKSLKHLASELGGTFKNFHLYYEVAKADVKARLGATASSHSRFLYIEQLLLNQNFGFLPELVITAERIYWSTFLDRLTPRDGVEQFLLELRLLNCSIVVVTDLTSDIQYRKILKLGLHTLIDYIFTSEFIGGDKSQTCSLPLVFRYVKEDPKSIWFIGDDTHDLCLNQDDLQGKTIHVSNFLVPDNKFSELTSLLRTSRSA